MGRNFSIASKKHQNDFDVLVIVRKRLKNGIAISFLELSTVAPKPRAEGSSPSAPASDFWLRKAISEAFLLLILPKILPSLCDVQIYGAVESVTRRLLCGLSTVDINSLGGLYAFVSEQNGNVLNRYAVIVEDTRHRVTKSVDRTMR